MEDSQLTVKNFNQIIDLSSTEDLPSFTSFVISEKLNYASGIYCFDGVNSIPAQYVQIYIVDPKRVRTEELLKTIYLKQSPKLIFLKTHNESVIIQQKIANQLSRILQGQHSPHPYLPEPQARTLIQQLTHSLSDYLQQGINYDCISLRNAVICRDGTARMSLAGYLLGVDRGSEEYGGKGGREEGRLAYSMGVLLFRVVYGFLPVLEGVQWKGFNPQTYLSYLKRQNPKKLLKIYYYCERDLVISHQCKDLLIKALDGNMKWQQWCSHSYLSNDYLHEKQHDINDQNRMIRMVNAAKVEDYSLIMSAISYREANPYEKLHDKTILVDEKTLEQAREQLENHSIFRGMRFDTSMKKSKVSSRPRQQHAEQKQEIYRVGYFNKDIFEANEDMPVRRLCIWIQEQKKNYINEEVQGQQNVDRALKRYGYPYAVAFELLKVKSKQPVQIKQKIAETMDLLLKLSLLNKPQQLSVDPLKNERKKSYNSFNQMKPQYRSNINYLYQYFMNEAMKKYNSKSQNMEKKFLGLEYYRLCLKLLEASLLMRKDGDDLNLERIETANRRDIQYDLGELLKKYFPQKPEIV